jgi:hypothetical protein
VISDEIKATDLFKMQTGYCKITFNKITRFTPFGREAKDSFNSPYFDHVQTKRKQNKNWSECPIYKIIGPARPIGKRKTSNQEIRTGLKARPKPTTSKNQ